MKILSTDRVLRFFSVLFRVLGIVGIFVTSAHAQSQVVTEVVRPTPSASAAQAEFGFSVAIVGDTMAVGARGDGGAGAVYLFERNEGGSEQWGLTQRLVSDDVAEGDRFGQTVALQGDVLAVGAPGDDDSNPSTAPGFETVDASGSVYIFERNAGGQGRWGQVGKLVASNGDIFENFGYSLSLSSNVLAVGQWREEKQAGSGGNAPSVRSGTDSGTAYLFEFDPASGQWIEAAFFESPRNPVATDEALFDNYARTLAISGNTLIVGASEEEANDPDQGTVYVYERDAAASGQWNEAGVLRASDGRRFDRFGRSVAIDGDTIVVGATGDDDAGPGAGTAFVFERRDGQWVETGKLVAGDGTGFEKFGEKVAINGDTIVVGAPDEDENGAKAGAIYIFQRNESGLWQQVAKITAGDGVADDRFGLAVAVEGISAIGAAPQRDGVGEDSGVAILYQLGGEPAGGYEDIFDGGPDLGGGWHFSDWFGFYNVNFYEPWLFHLEHVWMFVTPESAANSVFLYDLSSEGWFFTDSIQYPNMFSFDRNAWVFYFEDTSNPRNFVDLGTGEFFDLP